MIDKAVPAVDAFKILRSRVNGLEFNEFEEEYRKNNNLNGVEYYNLKLKNITRNQIDSWYVT